MALFSASVSDSQSRVLARKYRPGTFKEMIGQEALVQILTNSIEMDRLPHAFLLTGIRGVGKTTTARIIARALNCIGSDGLGTATASPCGICEPCVSIANDRHIDVIEMDAASRTGVEDVRDVIEGGRYKAVSARYKVYIIDEVHMLSKNAFNAFLKTLEEPPSHLKFIFATTELRKVPDTILSRCMRLQLNRIETETLEAYLQDICHREGRSSDQGAITLIARAADGSVRDGLSLLDQAMALCDGPLHEAAVLKMLGLSDRTILFQLFKTLIQGQAPEALHFFHQMYLSGSDPLMIIHDLMDLTHWMSLRKTGVTSEIFPGLDKTHLQEAQELGDRLSFPMISRCWQTLLKGIQEASLAPSAKQAVEVTLLRLCYLAPYPSLDDLIQNLSQGQEMPSEVSTEEKTSSISISQNFVHDAAQGLETISSIKIQSPEEASKTNSGPSLPDTFEGVLHLLEQRREMLLKSYLENDSHLISYKPGHLCLRFLPVVPKDTARRLKDLLTSWTNTPWTVTIGDEPGEPTFHHQTEEKRTQKRTELLELPLIQSALAAFPEAEIDSIEDHP